MMATASMIDLINYEIENGTQRSVAALYAPLIYFFMHSENGRGDMVTINKAIRARWSLNGLDKVKKMAWGIHAAMAPPIKTRKVKPIHKRALKEISIKPNMEAKNRRI